MKRIIIICEGQTEQEFCNNVLQKHFNERNVYLEIPTIKKTGGGIVNWDILKNQIEKCLIQDSNAFVTTFIDYYGLQANHNYPNWTEVQYLNNKMDALEKIEIGMHKDVSEKIKHRFIPYIQLHEFEALLFSDVEVFKMNYSQNEFKDYNYLLETVQQYTNPEEINNSSLTAPSKRLSRILLKYSKVIEGSLLAESIGLQTIRQKCHRFNQWLTNLEQI